MAKAFSLLFHFFRSSFPCSFFPRHCCQRKGIRKKVKKNISSNDETMSHHEKQGRGKISSASDLLAWGRGKIQARWIKRPVRGDELLSRPFLPHVQWQAAADLLVHEGQPHCRGKCLQHVLGLHHHVPSVQVNINNHHWTSGALLSASVGLTI
jgi:hypothetical protein